MTGTTLPAGLTAGPYAVGPAHSEVGVDTRSADRDGHLRSPDFSDAEKHPTMRHRSTGVDVHDGGFVLRGELTVKDVTRPVPLEVTAEGVSTDPLGNVRAGFPAGTDINRSDFRLSFNAVLETGGVLVGEKVRITLDISAIKQA